MRSFLSVLLCIAAPGLAQAVNVATGSTQVGDTDGIVAEGPFGASSFAAPDPTGYAVSDAAAWVWAAGFGSIGETNTRVFSFRFDLSGYDLSSATLSGIWGADSSAVAMLNGNTIGAYASFETLGSYGTGADDFFLEGENELLFAVTQENVFARGGGLLATVSVEADKMTTSSVPLPATAPLLLGGLALIAGLRRRRSS